VISRRGAAGQDPVEFSEDESRLLDTHAGVKMNVVAEEGFSEGPGEIVEVNLRDVLGVHHRLRHRIVGRKVSFVTVKGGAAVVVLFIDLGGCYPDEVAPGAPCRERIVVVDGDAITNKVENRKGSDHAVVYGRRGEGGYAEIIPDGHGGAYKGILNRNPSRRSRRSLR
jgi:hypothetical protein